MGLDKFLKAVLIATAAAALGPNASPAAPVWVNPLESVDQVRIEIVLGGDSQKSKLFEPGKRDIFSEQLEEKLTTRLASLGIGVSEDSEDLLSVGIWGHRESLGDGRQVSIFVLEIRAVDANYAPEAPCADDRRLDVEQGAVGLAEEGHLESVLLREILNNLNKILPSAKD